MEALRDFWRMLMTEVEVMIYSTMRLLDCRMYTLMPETATW